MEYQEFERLFLNGIGIDRKDRPLVRHIVRKIYDGTKGKDLLEDSVQPILEAFSGGYIIATLVERTANVKRFS